MRPIDAEKLIKNINMNFDDYAVYSDVFDVIDNAPTLDVAPVVHAHWDEIFEDWRIQISGNKCSSCGYEYYGDYHNYCPNCGAKPKFLVRHSIMFPAA